MLSLHENQDVLLLLWLLAVLHDCSSCLCLLLLLPLPYFCPQRFFVFSLPSY